MSASRYDGCVHDSVLLPDPEGCPGDITIIGPKDPSDTVSVAIHMIGLRVGLILSPATAVKLGELLVEAGNDNQQIMSSAVRP